MDFSYTRDQRRLRSEFRAWLAGAAAAGEVPTAATVPADATRRQEFLRAWQRRLAGARWIGIHWPREYGGRALGPVEASIVYEELARARCLELIGRIGVNLVGPTLLEFGTPPQRSRWLPYILDATHLWCQLFSEPEAGSDLAGLRTTAVPARGGWRLSGQKVWTSLAQFADWGLCLARTSPQKGPSGTGGGRTLGITAFVVDMRSPGVTVRPLRQLTGDAEFNEVFLDAVYVPGDQVVGDVGGGWRVATATLGRERGINPRQLVIHLQRLAELFELARDRRALTDPLVRQRLARSYVDIELFRLHSLRVSAQAAAGVPPRGHGSVVKLHWSEASKRMHATALALLGGDAVLSGGADRETGGWQRSWLYYHAASIWAGTNELQRTIVGERLLGLPREPREPRVPRKTHE
jgi:alkylation response protein AidB-like acyl-CoA dehydrogenase